MPPTFARAQIESILLDAARLDDARGAESPGVALARMGNGDLTLAEVERAAAEVGISRAAVSIAALRLALRDAHAASPRAHGEQEIAGELSGEARERLADAIRTRVSPSTVRTTADGVDVEIGKGNGEPGSLLVQVRSKGGATTISVWSRARALGGRHRERCGARSAGVPVPDRGRVEWTVARARRRRGAWRSGCARGHGCGNRGEAADVRAMACSCGRGGHGDRDERERPGGRAVSW
jgi:hypothetical protein